MKIEIRRPAWLALIATAAGLLNMHLVQAGNDTGNWHALPVKFLDNERWTLSTFTQLRLRDDSSELFA